MNDSAQETENDIAIRPPAEDGPTKWVVVSPKKPEPRNAEQVKLQKELRVLEGRSAMAEYEAARRAVHANAERLKALRLARDAALAANPPPAKAPTRRKTVKRA